VFSEQRSSEEQSPTVSLCVPLYRPDPRYLARLVDSFVAQQCDGLEVVMVDDASPGLDDEALEALLAPLREQIPITLSRNAHNLGMVGNWNRAVAAGHGELTMLVSQDDELGAGMLAAYTAEFVADPGVVLVSGSEEFIDEDSRPSSHKVTVGHRHNVFVHRDRYVLDHAELVRLSLRGGQGFGEPSAVMFRRAAFTVAGGYDPLFEHAADVDFYLRASMHGRAVYLRHAYLRRRWHDEGFTRTNFSTGALTRDRLRLYERYCDTEGLSERDRAEARSALASRSVYDVLRAARARQWNVARAALGNLRRGWRAPLSVHAAHVKEIATHRNRDER
jgi:glycosyltransferase involved in cell wall biosynthesis